MADVLLIQPPIRDFFLTAKRTIPYGLACIAASLEARGISVELFDALATKRQRVIDLPEEMAYLEPFYGKSDESPFCLFHRFRHFGYSYDHMAAVAKASGAFLVGISSLFTPYAAEALKAAETVKQVLPDCKIVLGGHHPTALPERVMAHEAVDYVIRGEGETAMPELVKVVAAGGDVALVPGIVFRKSDGSLHVSPPAMTTKVDSAFPALHHIRHRFYQRNKAGSMVVTASRGCPMTCSYCVLGSNQFPYRRRSVASVIKEIDMAVTHHHVRFIDFEDENLSLHRQWFLDLMDRVASRFGHGKLELRAMNGLYPPSLDAQRVRVMKQAGFQVLNLSVGSFSKSQLKRFHRPDVRQGVGRALDLATSYGMDAVCYIIAGAPGQSPDDSVADLLQIAAMPAIAGVSVFYPAPGSADYAACQTLGLLPASFSLMRSSAIPISHTTSRIDSVTILRLGRMLNFMKSILRKGDAIPGPEPCQSRDYGYKDLSRYELGRKLLSWFLYDGKIRGITSDGDVYTHQCSQRLIQQFVRGIPRICQA